MRTNRVWAVAAGTLIVFMMMTGIGFSGGEKATKEECVAKTKEAAQLIKQEGVEAALAKINDRNGPFVWKDSYVFCFEEETYKMTGHPFAGQMLGMSMKNYLDDNGKPVFQEFAKMVKAKGRGWVDYMHVRRPGEDPLKKNSYVMKVPDTNIIVGAGCYEEPAQQ